MQVGVAKYVNSVSKPGLQTGMHTGRHTDRHVWTPLKGLNVGDVCSMQGVSLRSKQVTYSSRGVTIHANDADPHFIIYIPQSLIAVRSLRIRSVMTIS